MTNLFKSSIFGVSKLFICIFLIVLTSAFKIYFTNYDVLIEVDFRGTATPVTNHNLIVKSNYPGSGSGSPLASIPDPLTNYSCVSVHQGTLSQLDPSASATTNSLEVTPSTANDNADYVNGVSTIDLIRIQQHYQNSVPFTDGYQKLSADANDDDSVGQLDLNMITDLITGNRSDLTRPSWEYFDAAHITSIGASTLLANPWYHTLSYLCTGTLVVNGVSRNQIANGTAVALRTVKIGDVKASSGTSENSWTCTSGTYFNKDQVESRSNEYSSPISASEGSEIVACVKLNSSEPFVGIEIPIHINHNLFEIKSVRFANGFEPDWHFNKETDRLTFLKIDRELKGLNIIDGKIIFISIIPKSRIGDINKEIYFSKERNVEIVNKEAELAKASIRLSFDNVISRALEARILNSFSGAQLEVNIPEQSLVEIQILNLNGQVIHKLKENLVKGLNRLNIPHVEGQGINILNLVAGKEKLALKYVN
ncbi:MAG: hypothetical protein ABI761_17060 [Saprospiraceae bacterium]